MCRSFKDYFDAAGNTEAGDCGERLCNIYSIGSAVYVAFQLLSAVPYIGAIPGLINCCLLGPALLVFYIIILVKMGQLKGMIPENSIQLSDESAIN